MDVSLNSYLSILANCTARDNYIKLYINCNGLCFDHFSLHFQQTPKPGSLILDYSCLTWNMKCSASPNLSEEWEFFAKSVSYKWEQHDSYTFSWFSHIDISIRDVLVTHLLMGWYKLEQQFTVLREESIQVCVQYEVFDLGGRVANASLCNHCMQEGTMENDG